MAIQEFNQFGAYWKETGDQPFSDWALDQLVYTGSEMKVAQLEGDEKYYELLNERVWAIRAELCQSEK